MALSAGIKKAVQRIMVILFSALEVLGLPRVPRRGRQEESLEP